MNLDARSIEVQPQDVAQASLSRGITVFLCENCARPARAATSAGRPRPLLPDFRWPWPVNQATVSCAGRLQPEHILKAFESGAEAVCVVACHGGNCHYVEGSKRCARRTDYLRSILDEIGLGGERLMLFNLPGTAAEDMAVASGRTVEEISPEALSKQVHAIRERVIETLRGLSPDPLRLARAAEALVDSQREVEFGNDKYDE